MSEGSLESRYAELVTKNDHTESELAFQKKRYESFVAKAQAEKEAELEALKQNFLQVSEKRKEAFTQLKEKLQQASVVVNQYATAQQEATAALAANQSLLADAQARLAQQEAELQQVRAAAESAAQNDSQRIASLESELNALRSASSSSTTNLAEITSELEAAKARLEAAEEKAKGKPTPKNSISVEDNGAGEQPLFAGILENGRTLAFKWSFTGSARIQWYRSFRGGQFEPIMGKAATKPTYNVNADDIGACLRAEATHTVTGASVFAEIGPVHPARAMIEALIDPLRKLDATFTVESSSAQESGGDKQRRILMNKEKIKLQDAKGKTVAKKEWSDALKMTLDGDSDRRFSIQIEASGPVVSYTAPNQRMRDLIVITVRFFLYINLKCGGKLSKDLDHQYALSLQLRTLNEQTHLRAVAITPSSKRTNSISGTVGGAAAATAATAAKAGSSKNLAANPAAAAPAAAKPRASGGDNGSEPSTPQSKSVEPSATQISGLDRDRKVSNADDGDWSLPPSAAASARPSTSNLGAAGPPGGAGAVDADGFMVTKNRGFDDYAPKGAGEDSDPEDVEGEEARGPAIKVQINAEARAPATAGALKNATNGLQLGGPTKGKKGGKKGEKKGKKGKKDEEGDVGNGAAASPSGAVPGFADFNGAQANIASNSVAGLPPLAPQTAAVDASDPFAAFF